MLGTRLDRHARARAGDPVPPGAQGHDLAPPSAPTAPDHVRRLRAVQPKRLVAVSTFNVFTILNRVPRPVLVTPSAGGRGDPQRAAPAPMRKGVGPQVERLEPAHPEFLSPGAERAPRRPLPPGTSAQVAPGSAPGHRRRGRWPAPCGSAGDLCPVSYRPLFGGPLCSL